MAIAGVGMAAALAAGFGLGRATGGAAGGAGSEAARPPGVEVYTCSMHPQIRLPGPGDCPICQMPLIPAGTASDGGGGSGDEPPSLQLDRHAIAMASVETAAIGRRPFTYGIHAVGKIEYNESSLATITARIGGYAERLFVNFTGIEIKAGDHLAEVYSPDLLVAQQELLIALQASGQGPLVDTARVKLRLWGLTDAQIDETIRSKRVSERMTLYSPISGTVIDKPIVQSSAFQAGEVLYRIANLDSVWVYLDVYEYDLAWVRYGQQVELEAEAYPGRPFRGVVTFVRPMLDERTRTVRVPVHIENPDHLLKPGMFVSATIQAALGADGSAAPTGVEGKHTCPMHPQVLEAAAGACSFCGMALERIPGAPEPAAASGPPEPPPPPLYACPMRCEGERTYKDPAARCPVCGMKLDRVESPADAARRGLLALPASAVLDSGLRKLVYVDRGEGRFEPREVTLGPRSDRFFAVLGGLAEGERIAVRGGFLIDSQFQVTGHPSLFYPGGLAAPSAHDGHARE